MTDDIPRPRLWSKFWWRSWTSDAALRNCSLAARGLWMEMLCLAAQGDDYGYLRINGVVLTPSKIGSQTGQNWRTIQKLLAELRTHGVFSETPQGVIYCRRMVREMEHWQRSREAGKKGGNPAITERRDGPPEDEDVSEVAEKEPSETLKGTLNPFSSEPLRVPLTPTLKGTLNPLRKEDKKTRRRKKEGVSIAHSSSNGQECGHLFGDAQQSDFDAFWTAYPRKVGKGAARRAWAGAMRKVRGDAAAIIAAVRDYPFPPDAQFVPHPATWLNGERWADDRPDAAAPSPEPGPAPRPNAIGSQYAALAERYAWDDRDGRSHPVVGGWYLDVIADLVREAAGYPHGWCGDLRPLAAWLQDGLDPHDAILPAIMAIARRADYRPPGTLAYFDRPVRERRAA